MKKSAKQFIYLVFALVLFFTGGCRPVVMLDKPYEGRHYAGSYKLSEIFDTFWQAMNNNYVYWNLETEKYWNSVYDKYYYQFDDMGLLTPELFYDENEMPITGNALTAYTYFKEMLAPLHDGNLSVDFKKMFFITKNPNGDDVGSFPGQICPQDERVSGRPGSNDSKIFLSDWSSDDPTDPNWNFFTAVSTYLTNSRSTGSAPVLRAATGRITHSLGDGKFISYFYFSSFAIKDSYSYRPELKSVVDVFSDSLKQPGFSGLIIDVRGNSGGNFDDISRILSPFLETELKIAYTRTKKTTSPLDYTSWAPYRIKPAPAAGRAKNIHVPIVLLCNDYTKSSAELLALAVKRMPRGIVIGSKTWGSVGPVFDPQNTTLETGGSFYSDAFWTTVIQSGYQVRDIFMNDYTGEGIMPDIEIPLNASAFHSEQADTQLEAAITYIDPGIDPGRSF
ncbi:MAG: hypothetical protein LBD07_05835 [Spirochaetaceae bacterium]|nr:hypothetical protein [Spirochaetaceae bacterium]